MDNEDEKDDKDDIVDDDSTSIKIKDI